MCGKPPNFDYGDIRHVHRIYASNWEQLLNSCSISELNSCKLKKKVL